MCKRLCIIFCFLAGALVVLPVQPVLTAQTADVIEQLLETGAVTYGQAAKFVLEAADLQEHAGSQAQAFSYAQENKWLPAKASGGDEATLQGVSLLLLESFGMKGGLFYSLAKSPHYAYRELVYKEVIIGRTDPDMAVSGDLLLFMVGRALTLREDAL